MGDTLRVSEIMEEDGKHIRLVCFRGKHFTVEHPWGKELARVIATSPCDGTSCGSLPEESLAWVARRVYENESEWTDWYGNTEVLEVMGIMAPLTQPIYLIYHSESNYGFGAYEGEYLKSFKTGDMFFVNWADLGFKTLEEGETVTTRGTSWSEGPGLTDVAEPTRTTYVRQGDKIVRQK